RLTKVGARRCSFFYARTYPVFLISNTPQKTVTLSEWDTVTIIATYRHYADRIVTPFLSTIF
ncbi:hypothetical protein, partial [Bacteroides acidifaciens]